MAELTHQEVVCLQVEDFSGYLESSAKKKSSRPAPREEPSRRRVAASRRRAHARVPRAAGVPPPTHQERGPRLAHATCVSEEPGRMSGKCQYFLVRELLHEQLADIVASRRLHPVRVNYGRVRSAR